ncbi:lamin tail domain-containing protein [Streptomyces sp. NBC_01217]|uniref:lamin tail domain-containing protein n=1 Tax=Streptomyces sp. NBC_01217 TaxID=2903779 RepID=UPI002E14434C|nr:lamin tail domain-containing protein [Streptomyces sp. NBC_01217]
MSRSARRFTATVLASGALVAAAALPATAADHDRGHGQSYPRSAVVLGAIQYDSPGFDNGTNRSLNSEWVTVTNTSRYPVNLRGWTLSDESRNTYRFNLWLAGRSSVRVHTGIGRDTSRDIYQDRRSYVWDANDTATLRDARGYRVDSTSWGRDRDRDRDHRDRDHRDRDHRDRDHDGRNGHQGRDDRGGRNHHDGRG